LPLFGLPKIDLNTSTVAWIEDELSSPPTETMMGAAEARVDTAAVAKESASLASSILDLPCNGIARAAEHA
jgi:hypothetical protein